MADPLAQLLTAARQAITPFKDTPAGVDLLTIQERLTALRDALVVYDAIHRSEPVAWRVVCPKGMKHEHMFRVTEKGARSRAKGLDRWWRQCGPHRVEPLYPAPETNA